MLLLDNMQILDEAILVTIDVEIFYPSIPQSECINTIYSEMEANRLTVATYVFQREGTL